MKQLFLAAATLLLIQGADLYGETGSSENSSLSQGQSCSVPAKRKPSRAKSQPCKTECAPSCDPCCPPVCFERGYPTNSSCTPSAYSESAAFDLDCGWDGFATASFIYWQALQGGMDLALPGQGTIAGGLLSSAALSPLGFDLLQTDFEYQPGFQIGIGWSGAKDRWSLYAEYTWLHGSTNTSARAPNPNVATLNGTSLPQSGVWFPTTFLSPLVVNDATTNISSKWTYKIDLLDAQISRPFYSGARFTVEPFFGLRSAWIRQELNLNAPVLATSTVAAASANRTADYTSHGTGVGPRIGMNGNWHIGYGLRFEGNAAASLLFTGFDVTQNVSSPDASGDSVFPIHMQLENLHGLRPNLDLGLGLGWGSYFKCRRFHWDLAATYDFTIFWEQNMMRYLADTSVGGVEGSAGDLYLQGLTIKTQFDF